jgi:hypothetical protein
VKTVRFPFERVRVWNSFWSETFHRLYSPMNRWPKCATACPWSSFDLRHSLNYAKPMRFHSSRISSPGSFWIGRCRTTQPRGRIGSIGFAGHMSVSWFAWLYTTTRLLALELRVLRSEMPLPERVVTNTITGISCEIRIGVGELSLQRLTTVPSRKHLESPNYMQKHIKPCKGFRERWRSITHCLLCTLSTKWSPLWTTGSLRVHFTDDRVPSIARLKSKMTRRGSLYRVCHPPMSISGSREFWEILLV